MEYFLTVNEKTVGHMILRRGLRQGKPPSPYFLFCVEWLTNLTHKAEARGNILGSKVCREHLPLQTFYLLTVVYLFSGLIQAKVRKIKDTLYTYERASGQAINL